MLVNEKPLNSSWSIELINFEFVGVRRTFCLVKLWSKLVTSLFEFWKKVSIVNKMKFCKYSNYHTIWGLNGGFIFFASIAFQSTSRKNGWLLISLLSASRWAQPKRLVGSLVRSYKKLKVNKSYANIKLIFTPSKIDVAWVESHFGYRTASSRIALNKSSSLSDSNGGCPTIIS